MDQQQAVRKQDDQPPVSPPISFLKEFLPSGSRPSDAYLGELLRRKFTSNDASVFDFYSYEPEKWHLAPAKENIHHHDDGKTYIFAPFEAKIDHGIVNRDTPNGYWMATGRRLSVIEGRQGDKFACKDLLNFFTKRRTDDDHFNDSYGIGEVSKRERKMDTEVQTLWQMHEIRLIPGDRDKSPGIVLCVAYKTKPRVKPVKKKKTWDGHDQAIHGEDASTSDSWSDSDWDTEEEEA